MDISFEIVLILFILIFSFVTLFLKNNSPDALYGFIFNLISKNSLMFLFCAIILLILIFNIRIF
jgi:hypothetical protein